MARAVAGVAGRCDGTLSRRTCDVCGLKADATDPPLPTCHCGKRRYCGEECQAKDWAAGHAKTCKSGYLYLDG